MGTKKLRNYIDHGFGFPVHFDAVDALEFDGECVPDVNYRILKECLIREMPHRSGALTGAEIRFIRLYLGQTLVHFGDWLGVTHPAVKAWEKHADAPTNMVPATEKMLRIKLAVELGFSEQEIVALIQGTNGARDGTPKPFRFASPPTEVSVEQYRILEDSYSGNPESVEWLESDSAGGLFMNRDYSIVMNSADSLSVAYQNCTLHHQEAASVEREFDQAA